MTISASTPKFWMTDTRLTIDDRIINLDQFKSKYHVRNDTMPAPQKVYVQRASAIEPKGTVRSTFDALISPENRGVVTSIAAFGVCSELFGHCY